MKFCILMCLTLVVSREWSRYALSLRSAVVGISLNAPMYCGESKRRIKGTRKGGRKKRGGSVGNTGYEDDMICQCIRAYVVSCYTEEASHTHARTHAHLASFLSKALE